MRALSARAERPLPLTRADPTRPDPTRARARKRTLLGRDTCLHLAARHGHRAICFVLLQYGADPEALNKYAANPLHYAASLSIARLLIRAGSRTTQRDARGQTPTEAAIADMRPDGMVAHLLEITSTQEREDYEEKVAMGRAQAKEIAALRLRDLLKARNATRVEEASGMKLRPPLSLLLQVRNAKHFEEVDRLTQHYACWRNGIDERNEAQKKQDDAVRARYRPEDKYLEPWAQHRRFGPHEGALEGDKARSHLERAAAKK